MFSDSVCALPRASRYIVTRGEHRISDAFATEERVEVVADGGAMLTAVWEDPYTLQRRTVNLPARAFDPD
jgi:hypothetical protein